MWPEPPCGGLGGGLGFPQQARRTIPGRTGARINQMQRKLPMRIRHLLLASAAAVAAFMFGTGVQSALAQTAPALSGQVSSAEEGVMEGVVVSAKKDGSTISTSVV